MCNKRTRNFVFEYLHVLERGSRGPSTVTLIALVYVATCGGLVDMVIVTEKLLPGKRNLQITVNLFVCEQRKKGWDIFIYSLINLKKFTWNSSES